MKKGISLIALVATIAISIILISTVTISGVATVNDTKKMELATELSMISETVNSYITKNNGTFPVTNIVSVDISGVSTKSKYQFNDENIVNNKVTLYEIDYKLLDLVSLKKGLKKGGESDIYVMSKDTNKIYYALGVKIGSKTYYTLEEDLSKSINYNKTENSFSTNGVVFVPTTTKYTNKNVDVVVKVPTGYTAIEVAVDSTNIALTTSDTKYKIYDIKNKERKLYNKC
ncbi:MAG: hypothetical protein RSE41_02155 [Clostridia bacterium]